MLGSKMKSFAFSHSIVVITLLAFAGAETNPCWTTTCQPALPPRDLCSVASQFFTLFGTQLSAYDEAMRESCSLNDGSPEEDSGISVLCCPLNSTLGRLQTMYGAESHEFPHMAALLSNVARCSASIYNHRFILTAAHCVVDELTKQVVNSSDLTVILGTNFGAVSGLARGMKLPVEKVYVHENYSDLVGSEELEKPLLERTTYNDIALLELKENITFGPNIQAIEVAPEGFKPIYYADSAIVAGWGQLEGQSTEGLHKANLPIRWNQECWSERGTWPSGKDHRDKLLCLGGAMNGKYSPTSRPGDSGGPAICRGPNGTAVLCGIASFSSYPLLLDCSTRVMEFLCKPGVYTRVSTFRDWIQNIAGEQEEDSLYKPYVYGDPVPANKYKSHVHITSFFGESCGGTLVSQDTILTAAHCVVNPDTMEIMEEIEVTTGVRDLKQAPRNDQIFAVKKFGVFLGSKSFRRVGRRFNLLGNVALNNNFTRIAQQDYYYEDDIAIIKLHRKVNISESELPEIPSLQDEISMEAIEVAFPRNISRSGEIHQRKFDLLGFSECQRRIDRMQNAGLNLKVNDNLICGVRKYSGGSQCDRELGGGLYCKGEEGKELLCGVQIFRLCEYSIPNAFVDTAKFKEWIDEMKA